jgi:hypothetical protein
MIARLQNLHEQLYRTPRPRWGRDVVLPWSKIDERQDAGSTQTPQPASQSTPAPSAPPPPILVIGPHARTAEIGPETRLNELPQLPGATQWDLIEGLEAVASPGPQLAECQTPLQLTAVATDGRHRLGIHFRNLAAGGIYRAMVWIKGPAGTKVQVQVRDSIDPQSGKAHVGEVRYDLATGTALMAQGNALAEGVEQAADDWRKVWVNLRTADGQIFVNLGMIEAGTNSPVFKGVGQQLTFGGIALTSQ